MKPKFCTCRHADQDLCPGPIQPCFCACHKAERRSVVEVEADLRARLEHAVIRSDFAADPQGPSFITISDPIGEHRSVVVVEYEPKEGFGLTLTGWGEDDDRTYTIDSVVKKILYWFSGHV